jgi:hypothetical protein
MQGCFNGNAFDWDQQFWSDIGDCPIYRVRYMRGISNQCNGTGTSKTRPLYASIRFMRGRYMRVLLYFTLKRGQFFTHLRKNKRYMHIPDVSLFLSTLLCLALQWIPNTKTRRQTSWKLCENQITNYSPNSPNFSRMICCPRLRNQGLEVISMSSLLVQ